MMDPLESDVEHDQLPSVEEYKTTVAQVSKGGVFSRLDPESGSSQTYKKLDPDASVASEGIYGSSFEIAADTEEIEFYKDTTVEERKGLSSLKILCFSFVFLALVGLSVFLGILFTDKEEYERLYDWVRGETDDYLAIVDYVAKKKKISDIDAFSDKASPQFLAAQWMAHSDGMTKGIPSTEDEEIVFEERYIMSVFYFGTNGPSWKHDYNFLTDAHICAWNQDFKVNSKNEDVHGKIVTFGVHDCKSVNNELIPHRIYMPNNDIVGQIPSEFAKLDRLEYLNLASNKGIYGKLNSSLGMMKSLTELMLRGCSLSGPIPPWIQQLTNLKFLGLGNNGFTGTVPNEIGKLSNLELLGLDDNYLYGDISLFKDLKNIKSLYLGDNYLSGSLDDDNMIDTWWPDLEELDLNYNVFTGKLPSNFLNHPKLVVIDVQGNRLTGQIPEQINTSERLQFLALDHNQFTGSVPSDISNLSNLYVLDLSHNQFMFELPMVMRDLKQLELLNVGENNFQPNTFPVFLEEMTSLTFLGMRQMKIYGKIPDSLEYLSNLEFLDVKGNQLTGSIPSIMNKLTNLDTLLIEQNDIGGTADAICNADNAIGRKAVEATFVADCDTEDLSSDPSKVLGDCTCCTTCCKKGDASCNQDPLMPDDWVLEFDGPQFYNGRLEKYSAYPTIFDDDD